MIPAPPRTRAAWIAVVAVALCVSPARAANETWVPLPLGPTGRAECCTAFDPVSGRMIMFGGYGGINETWSLTMAPTPQWAWHPTATSPTGRHGSAMVYDPVRHRMLMFGGYDNNYRNDVWALSLGATPNWSLVTTTGTPPTGRMYTTMVYDPIADRLLLMGGHPILLNDVWALQLSAPVPQWSQIDPLGSVPAPRYGHVGIFDAGRNRLIIWGGESGGTGVWALSLAGTPAWTLYNLPGGPTSRILASAVYDSGNDRMIMFGGASATNQVWSLLLGPMAWQQVTPAGAQPLPRWNHACAIDPYGSRMMIYGGYTNSNPTLTETAHALTWAPVSPAPLITGFNPTGGQPGNPVTITGLNLAGATQVRFNGVIAPVLSASLTAVQTTVPAEATTGPIEVTTPAGIAVSSLPFTITQVPLITSFSPDSGYIGDNIVIRGSHFSDVTSVSLGNAGPGSFVIVSDSVIIATVTPNSSTGFVVVSNPFAAIASTTPFRTLSPYPPPRIVSVRDVKSDQGGKVTIKWIRSENDGVNAINVRSYRIWRRALSDASLRNGTAALKQMSFASGVVEFWEDIGTVAAARLPGYAFTAQTPQDSIAESNPFSAFFIQALTEDVNTFYSSRVDSGYSVDNLSPPAPMPFVAVYGASGTALHWNVSRAPDFAEFRLHRGVSTDFIPDAGNLVTAQRDTGYFDPDGAGAFHYKLAAVDLHGNFGRYVPVSPMGPTAVLATPMSAKFENGRVKVRWYVATDELAECAIERREGTGSWMRIGQATPEGSGNLEWEDAEVEPGVRYAYRLVVPTEDGTFTGGEIAIDVPGGDVDAAVRIPNPVLAGDVTVSLRAPAGQPVRIELVDVSGRRVASVEATGQGERTTLRLARSETLTPGIYFVRFQQPALPSRRVAIVR